MTIGIWEHEETARRRTERLRESLRWHLQDAIQHADDAELGQLLERLHAASETVAALRQHLGHVKGGAA